MDNNKNIYQFQVNREIIEKVETTKKVKMVKRLSLQKTRRLKNQSRLFKKTNRGW